MQFGPSLQVTLLGAPGATVSCAGCLTALVAALESDRTGAPGWLSRLHSDFSSGRDLVVQEFGPRVGLCADSSEPLGCWVPLSLCPCPARPPSLSLKNTQTLKKLQEKVKLTYWCDSTQCGQNTPPLHPRYRPCPAGLRSPCAGSQRLSVQPLALRAQRPRASRGIGHWTVALCCLLLQRRLWQIRASGHPRRGDSTGSEIPPPRGLTDPSVESRAPAGAGRQVASEHLSALPCSSGSELGRQLSCRKGQGGGSPGK